MLFKLLLQALVLGLEAPALLHDLIEPLPDVLHLLLHGLSLIALVLRRLQLGVDCLYLFVVAHAEGLDEVEEELGAIGGVLFLGLEDILIVVDGEFDFIFERFDHVRQIIRVGFIDPPLLLFLVHYIK